MIDNDYHLSTPCKTEAGGCGAAVGENCRPGCVGIDGETEQTIDYGYVDSDYVHDMILDYELGVY